MGEKLSDESYLTFQVAYLLLTAQRSTPTGTTSSCACTPFHSSERVRKREADEIMTHPTELVSNPSVAARDSPLCPAALSCTRRLLSLLALFRPW
jgi:hypothetical protein